MSNMLKRLAAASVVMAMSQVAAAQVRLSIDSCYRLARENYPLVRQYGLIRQATALSVANLEKGYLPQAEVAGQASWQSDVPAIPVKIPGVTFPVPDKDQYRVYAGVSQLVYDGGVTTDSKALARAQGKIAEESLAVRLHQLSGQVNRLFFGLCLLDVRLRQNALMKKDLRAGIGKATATVKEGAALQTGVDMLEAAWLKADQQTVELKAERQAFVAMLGLLIHRSLDSSTIFLQPAALVADTVVRRPELQLFNYRRQALAAKADLLSASGRPRFSLFGQAGYGRPAFNIFSNRFQPFYIAGLRMSIPLSRLYTLHDSRSLLETQREETDVEKKTFLFNIRMQRQRQDATVGRLRKVLASDRKIITLRAKIKKASLVQLQNGVTGSSDYLREVDAEYLAREDSNVHAMQLLQAEYDNRALTAP